MLEPPHNTLVEGQKENTYAQFETTFDAVARCSMRDAVLRRCAPSSCPRQYSISSQSNSRVRRGIYLFQSQVPRPPGEHAGWKERARRPQLRHRASYRQAEDANADQRATRDRARP